MSKVSCPRLILAGLKGGSGKTTVTLGLIGALSRQLKITPYKKGPDYIDPGWLSQAAKSPCYSLDPYMIGAEGVVRSFVSHFRGDMAIIEGNRGLYDGMDAEGSYSTAELAKLLKAPVILVVDCTKITRTAAALVLGAQSLDRAVEIRGVILNQVSSLRHEGITKEAIERYCNIPVLGALPRLKDSELPERHMGLVPIYEYGGVEASIKTLSDRAAAHIDLEAVLRIAYSAKAIDLPDLTYRIERSEQSVKIGILRDEAFQFYYPENLEELQSAGAELVYINALDETHLPDIDCLYIGGGFPETNALRLADNRIFRESLREAIDNGLPTYAECGGLMFLGKSITVDGKDYEMAGIFPLSFKMGKRPQAHGYTEAEVTGENPFYPIGTLLRGHEFHYSAVVDLPGNTTFALTMRRGKGIAENMDGIVYKNCMALYTHIHALGTEGWAKGMIQKAKEYKDGKRH